MVLMFLDVFVVPLASTKEQPGLLVQHFGKAGFQTQMGPPTTTVVICNSILVNVILQSVIHTLSILLAK